MATRSCTKLQWNSNSKESGSIFSAPSGNGWTTQSLAYKDRSTRYIICNNTSNDNAKNNIIICGKTTSIKLKNKIDAGHANGACYCHENGYVYVLPAAHGSSKSVKAYDPSNWKHKFTVTLKVSIGGLAYDRVTKQFYGANGSSFYVFPYSGFAKSGTCAQYKSFKKAFPVDNKKGYYQQNCGGHNGVVMCCQSTQTYRGNNPAYIDCYRASDGQYLHTYSSTGEIESVAVEETTNRLQVMWAKHRELIRCTTIFNLTGAPAKFANDTTTVDTYYTQTKSILPEWYAAMEEQFNWSKNQVYHWIDKPTVKNSKANGTCITFPSVSLQRIGILPEGGYFYFNPKTKHISGWPKNYVKDHPEIFTLSYPNKTVEELGDEIKPGDIVGYGQPGYHTQVFMGYNEKGKPIFNTMGHTRKLKSTSSYSTRKINMLVHLNDAITNTSQILAVSPEKLYSSANYEYLAEREESESSQKRNAVISSLSEIIKNNNTSYSGIPDTNQNLSMISAVTPTGEVDRTKRAKTKVEGEVFGPSLPVALNPVEAPFVELTIGDFVFGVYENDSRYDRYPNYIQSLNVKKTNGSMNEYTIELVHQVRPGSNPNFIDELLSKNGYNKITIKYGDSNSGIEFIDSNALLVGVNISFDFTNCNIHYTLKATSSAISIASHKRTFPSKEDKPSNIIRDLLYSDSNEDLLTAFPRMRDKNFVEKNNLIPTNDCVVEIDEFKNVNTVSYLNNLVSVMKSNVDDIVNSNYMLTINDGYFKISEISTSYSYDASLYEVNINYPDDNQVFSFNINTNYSWPIAYKYSGDVPNYNYEINSVGNTVTYNTNSSNLLDFSSPSQDSLNNNWWKQVTEFPISATLTCRGLLSPLLLLTYIKINCVYYGGERITSGVYIVTGQEDSLSGGGYKTTLSLLRVSNSKQHIIVDGRVKT